MVAPSILLFIEELETLFILNKYGRSNFVNLQMPKKKVDHKPTDALLWTKALRIFVVNNDELLSVFDAEALLSKLEYLELFLINCGPIDQIHELTNLKKRTILSGVLSILLLVIVKLVRNNPSFLISLYGFQAASKLTALEYDPKENNGLLLIYWILFASLELMPLSSNLLSFRNIIKSISYNVFRDNFKRKLVWKWLHKSRIEATMDHNVQ
eukprot:NODE_581_length_5739_cov_0.670922.p5 type:complete len:212 gc:universal NODE_581_length_5739_cov_0.670922:2641-3276(+)